VKGFMLLQVKTPFLETESYSRSRILWLTPSRSRSALVFFPVN
jgi:hypothetical protein